MVTGDLRGCFMDLLCATDPSIAQKNLDSNCPIPLDPPTPIPHYDDLFPNGYAEAEQNQFHHDSPDKEDNQVVHDSINQSTIACDESCGSQDNTSCTIRSFTSLVDKQTEDDASSSSHCYRKMEPDGLTTLVGEKRIPNRMEEYIRAYNKDKTVLLFKPEIGMVFGSAIDAYQFYNLYSWVCGFSIRSGDSYTNTKKS